MKRPVRASPILALSASLVLVGALSLLTGAAPEAPPADTAAFAAAAGGDPAPALVHRITYEGPITPVAVEFIAARLAQAAQAAADAVVLQLDTPGGLDASIRVIVKDILASPVPVIVHVAPPGARAASAGAFILLAGHAAAMAPGTNVGSASPVQIGGAVTDSVMAAKVMSDAAAYIASLARQRGRDEALARRFVTEAINLTADEALQAGLIEAVAPTTAALLDSLQGREVAIGGRTVVLALAGARIEDRPMGPRQRLLKWLADPNVAYLLMLLGIYGIFFELSNPGALVPGILGAISLLLALFAFQALPVNYAGVALILLGLVMLVLEVKVTSYGGLTLGGLTALVLGSLMLFDSPEPWAQLKLTVLVPAVAVFGGFFVLCVWLVIRGQRRPTVTGFTSLVGKRGRVVVTLDGGEAVGKVVFHGELWDARCAEAVPAGAQVEVVEVSGRIATVRPVSPVN
jgi:membrane-bound serine protease (ClpP class)